MSMDIPADVQQRAELEVSDSAVCKVVSKDTSNTAISSQETRTQSEQPLQSLSEENLSEEPPQTRIFLLPPAHTMSWIVTMRI